LDLVGFVIALKRRFDGRSWTVIQLISFANPGRA
jgi:hypothetical protein